MILYFSCKTCIFHWIYISALNCKLINLDRETPCMPCCTVLIMIHMMKVYVRLPTRLKVRALLCICMVVQQKVSLCVFQYQCQGVYWMRAQWSLCAWSRMWPFHWSPHRHPQHEPAERTSPLAGSPGPTCSLCTADTEENETAGREDRWEEEKIMAM